MLHRFLTANREELIDRCRSKVARRLSSPSTGTEALHGIPEFLDQVVQTLQIEQTSERPRSLDVSGPAGGGPAVSEIGSTAAMHGHELLQQGRTVEQVVHDYGDLCQAIMDLAFEHRASIEIDEFRTLNRCLDNGIAHAVMEYAQKRDAIIETRDSMALNERLGSLAHELRNLIGSATLAVAAIRAGRVGLEGATGTILDRSLIGLRNLVDRSLAEVRVTAGMPPRMRSISLAEFVAEIKVSSSLEAESRGCAFTTGDVEEELALYGDRDLLQSAVGNLLQNAFKFTAHRTAVSLTAYAQADRIKIDVEDHCGGLPPGAADTLFRPFVQCGENRSGVGLGLTICRRSVEANGGVLHVRDKPGSGCVFTIDLPRSTL